MGNEDIKRKDVSTQKDWPDDDNHNPFVAFRRYADEQVSMMLQSITGLPSMNRMARQGTGDYTDNSSCPADRDSGSGHPGNRDGNDPLNYEKKVRPHWPESDSLWRRWYHGPSDFFGLDSFFDGFFEDRFFPFASQLLNSGHNRLLRDTFEGTDSPTWPIGYILFSPYSPLHLERQAQYQAHHGKGGFSSLMSSLHLNSDRGHSEPQWQEAFEDLLRLENDKPMLDRNASIAGSESGKDWLQGLVKRGSLGDKWNYVPGTNGQPWSGITFSGRAGPEQDRSQPQSSSEKEKVVTDTKEADSELDLYERFLYDIENREREFFRGVSESPLLRLLLEERRQQPEELVKYRGSSSKAENQHSHDGNENWIDLVSCGNKKSVPETPMDLPAEIDTKPTDAVSEPAQSRVVSTMTRTERVRLPDGSVESKIVNTRRFADGREESDESVEVSHPQRSSKPESDTSKNGWLWRD
ncbi:hypA-like protein [Penicillium digitatum]|uniref:HypA-like protein n=1 Tax=Penicillium digitatum TaxID=36651 RepID=A0A7T7BKW1_PENDI|nr:hypA-like protein [Penicillium digitatum]